MTGSDTSPTNTHTHMHNTFTHTYTPLHRLGLGVDDDLHGSPVHGSPFRICYANMTTYALSFSYPGIFVVPRTITDEDLSRVAKYTHIYIYIYIIYIMYVYVYVCIYIRIHTTHTPPILPLPHTHTYTHSYTHARTGTALRPVCLR